MIFILCLTYLTQYDNPNGIISLFLMIKKYSIVYTYHIFFIHSSVDGHLSCFHALVIVNSASMNIEAHVSFQIMLFSRCMPGSGIAGSLCRVALSFTVGHLR